jgi:hypothetical protein
MGGERANIFEDKEIIVDFQTFNLYIGTKRHLEIQP